MLIGLTKDLTFYFNLSKISPACAEADHSEEMTSRIRQQAEMPGLIRLFLF